MSGGEPDESPAGGYSTASELAEALGRADPDAPLEVDHEGVRVDGVEVRVDNGVLVFF